MTIEGLDRLKARLERMKRNVDVQRMTAGDLKPLHQSLLAFMRGTFIPIRTGEGAQSLRNPSHPNHIFHVRAGRVRFGSSLEYLKYQAHRIKSPPSGLIAGGVAKSIQRGK